MPQRVPSNRSRAANFSIEKKSKELELMGYRPDQAVAIALRMWNDGELVVIEPEDQTQGMKDTEKFLSIAKTIGALSTFYKSRQKQLRSERNKTMSRSERLKKYNDDD